jgi:hypothetical protein
MTERVKIQNGVIAHDKELDSLQMLFKTPIKIIKLKGYSEANKEKDLQKQYSAAKAPIQQGFNDLSKPGLQPYEVAKWLNKGGWTGLVIPKNYIVIDIDQKEVGEIIYKALTKESYRFHSIETPNGYQFVFRSNNKIDKQGVKVIMACGAIGDYRLAEKGYIVLPSSNTEKRKWIRIEQQELSICPPFFNFVKNLGKAGEPFPIPVHEGMRNNFLYSHCCRLVEFNYKQEDIWEIASFINRHFFIPSLDDSEFRKTVESALKHQPSGKSYSVNAKADPVRYEEVEWEEPVLFDEYDLPDFPVDVFPNKIRNMVEAVAEDTQTPIDLAAMIAFGVLSTALVKKFVVEPKLGWREHLNTYSVQLLESSNRKTAVYAKMTEPIYLYEKDLIEEMALEVKKRKAERGALEKRLENLQKEYAKESDPVVMEQIKETAEQLEQLPELYLPTLIVDDATPEILVTRMKENNEKLAIMSAEGDLFEKFKGKQSDQAKLDVYLKGYSADPLRVDRITRETERLNEPTLIICISAQPSVIHSLPQYLHDRGYLARFLFVIPKDFVGYRDNTAPSIPKEVRNQYIAFIKKLLSFSTEDIIVLRLDEEAKKQLLILQNDIEKEFRENGLFYDVLKFWGGKLVGQLLRLTGLLHIAHYATNQDMKKIPKVIDAKMFSRVVQLKDYFIAHAQKAFGVMKQNQVLADAQYVLKWLMKQEKLEIDKQELYQNTKKKFPMVDSLNRALNILESRSYIMQTLGGKSGRKNIIWVNPLLFAKQLESSPNLPKTDQIVENVEKKEGEQKPLKVPNSPDNDESENKLENENVTTINNTASNSKYKVVKL